MSTTIKSIAAAGAFAGLLFGAAAFAQTNWAPPAEIAPKAPAAAPAGGAPAAAATEAAPAAAPMSKQEKEKNCLAQADAKALKGKARKQFRADCMKS